MDDRFNTIAGWTLFAGIVALGLSSVSGQYFGASKPHRPEQMGYEIEGVVSSEGEEAVPLATLLATADVAKGEQVFKKCGSCHTINQGGSNGIGPNLFGVMGTGIGSHAPGFAYSSALSGHGGSWDFDNMDAWLANPKKFAPGTKMTFAGLSNPQDRADILAYMNAQGSNLPLPTPPAPAAPGEAPGGFGEPGTGANAGVSADPAGGAGPGGEETQAGPAAAGAVAQPAPMIQGGGTRAVGTVSETQAN